MFGHGKTIATLIAVAATLVTGLAVAGCGGASSTGTTDTRQDGFDFKSAAPKPPLDDYGVWRLETNADDLNNALGAMPDKSEFCVSQMNIDPAEGVRCSAEMVRSLRDVAAAPLVVYERVAQHENATDECRSVALTAASELRSSQLASVAFVKVTQAKVPDFSTLTQRLNEYSATLAPLAINTALVAKECAVLGGQESKEPGE